MRDVIRWLALIFVMAVPIGTAPVPAGAAPLGPRNSKKVEFSFHLSLPRSRGRGFVCAKVITVSTGRSVWEAGRIQGSKFKSDTARIRALRSRIESGTGNSKIRKSLRRVLQRLIRMRKLCKREGPKYAATPTPEPAPLEVFAGPDQLLVDEDGNGREGVTLTAEVKGAAGLNCTCRWSEDEMMLGENACAPVAIEFTLGTHPILLTITDVHGRSASSRVKISVISKSKPVASLGVNLDGLSEWTSAIPFVDLMKTSVRWVDQNWAPAQVPLDENGWPTSLGAAQYLSTLMVRSTGGPFPTGTYTVLYEGKGTMFFSFSAANQTIQAPGRITFEVVNSADSGIWLRISSIDPADPLRNIRVIMPGHEETYLAQPFNPRFVEHISNFGAIRFMDWMAANHAVSLYTGSALSATSRTVVLGEDASAIDQEYAGKFIQCAIKNTWQHSRMISDYNGASRTATLTADWDAGYLPDSGSACEVLTSLEVNWGDRRKPSYASWNQDRVKGAPLEVMVQLANVTGADPWFNLPYMATDDYVRQFATYVRDHLDPRRKVYIEYSNEVWNVAAAFRGQSGYAIAKGLELGLDTNRWAAGRKYGARRAVEIANIFSDVFGEARLRASRTQSRLVRILAGQNAWIGANTSYVMDAPVDGRPAHEYMDALAIADYYSGIALDDLERNGTVPEALPNQYRIKAPAAWAAQEGIYNGRLIEITSGAAAGDVRTVVSYDGTSKIATVNAPFSTPIIEGVGVRLVSKNVEELLDLMEAEVLQAFAAPGGSIFTNVKNAKARGLNTVVYEGGTHTDAAVHYPDSDQANVMLDAVNRHPRMKAIVMSALKEWKALGMDDAGRGPQIWCAFVAIGRWSHWGRWGHLEHVYQDPSTAPRWQGLLQFMAENPVWWE